VSELGLLQASLGATSNRCFGKGRSKLYSDRLDSNQRPGLVLTARGLSP
jgi:hypothetical protein